MPPQIDVNAIKQALLQRAQGQGGGASSMPQAMPSAPISTPPSLNPAPTSAAPAPPGGQLPVGQGAPAEKPMPQFDDTTKASAKDLIRNLMKYW